MPINNMYILFKFKWTKIMKNKLDNSADCQCAKLAIFPLNIIQTVYIVSLIVYRACTLCIVNISDHIL